MSCDGRMKRCWWFSLSISYPMPDVDLKIYSVAYREDVASKMISAQIAEAQRMTREWRPRKEGK